MERKQIIKALECCANNDECVGEACPYYATGCEKSMPKDALSLIEELTEDNKWSAKRIIETDKMVLQLKKENEGLSACTKILTTNNADLEAELALTYDLLEESKADTVRKMQEEINKTLSALCKGDISEIHRIVDQIAKEMLEGEK